MDYAKPVVGSNGILRGVQGSDIILKYTTMRKFITVLSISMIIGCVTLHAQENKTQAKKTAKTEQTTAKPAKKDNTTFATSLYEASWESLKEVPVPGWFEDGKFGIMIHWGAYSVPAWLPPQANGGYTEHLPSSMYRSPKVYNPFLKEKFGDTIPNFGYKDIIPLFKAEKFNADEWAKLFKDAGATYVIPVGEHHDGFVMWDSKLTDWSAAKMGPKRDVIGELAEATRNNNLKFGVSFHRERHYAFFDITKNKGGGPLPAIQEEIKRMPKAAGLYGPFEMSDDYMKDYVARWEELCDKYQPDFCWMDDFPGTPKDEEMFGEYCKKMLADYVNRANNEWGKEVYFNNKGGSQNWPDGVGCREKDNLSLPTIGPKWQNPATIGRSYGYWTTEDKNDLYKPSNELVHLLIETVSKNGNLLLNVGPKSDGTIPENQQKRLRDIGRWLKLNGEAIYNTRPWKECGEGRERFTTNKNKLYVIMLDWPKDDSLMLKSLQLWETGNISKVRMLGSTDLKWALGTEGLNVSLPQKPVGEYAYVIEITCNSDLSDLPIEKQMVVFEDLHQKHKARIDKFRSQAGDYDSTDY